MGVSQGQLIRAHLERCAEAIVRRENSFASRA